MTVSSQTSTATFVGNGVATAFPLPFRFFNNSDIRAYFIDSTTGAATPMVLGTDYTLIGAGEPEVDGSALSLLTTSAPLASMRGLYVERVMPQVQETDIVNQGQFFASSHEDVFDRLTMLIQQSNSYIHGVIRVAIGDPEPSRLAPAAQRAFKQLTFDENGNPIATVPNPSSAAALAILLSSQSSGSEGSRLVGYIGRTLFDRLRDYISAADYGAKGDGVLNDTAAFAALEGEHYGKVVDLGGRSYLVDNVPQKNSYINGSFKTGAALRPRNLSEGFTIPFGRYKAYGQQLDLLKASLCNPFEQFTGIAFLGDSITWGSTLPENGPGSNLTTLATRRDVFASPSFVNEFKRYIGREYFDGASPVISNWAASSSGEAIATYTKNVLTYPNRAPFTFTASGSATLTDTAGPNYLTQYIATLAVAAGSNTGTITMPNFTGEAFNVVFTAVALDAGSYELIVDGVSKGIFSTVPNGTTIIDGTFGNRISHTFNYVRNKTVQIVMSGVGAPGTLRFRIEAIEIPKTCRITNQGISGSNSSRYKARALTTAFLPDIAITAKDNFAFVQLGTNDRLVDSTFPNGVNAFEKQMAEIFDILDPLCNSIVMCANHVSSTNQGTLHITMQQIRGSLNRLAKARSYAFIDNYAVFTWIDPAASLADGLHPNALWHQMIYRNIVEAIERA